MGCEYTTIGEVEKFLKGPCKVVFSVVYEQCYHRVYIDRQHIDCYLAENVRTVVVKANIGLETWYSTCSIIILQYTKLILI